jgi:hypothetical protein
LKRPRQLKRVRNAVFLDFLNSVDDLQPKALIKTNAPFKIPARDAHMLKIINHSFLLFL